MKILKMAFFAKETEDILARQQGGRDKAKRDGRFASGGVPFGLRWVHLRQKSQKSWLLGGERGSGQGFEGILPVAQKRLCFGEDC